MPQTGNLDIIRDLMERRIGSSSEPLVFRVGLDFHFRIAYEFALSKTSPYLEVSKFGQDVNSKKTATLSGTEGTPNLASSSALPGEAEGMILLTGLKKTGYLIDNIAGTAVTLDYPYIDETKIPRGGPLSGISQKIAAPSTSRYAGNSP